MRKGTNPYVHLKSNCLKEILKPMVAK